MTGKLIVPTFVYSNLERMFSERMKRGLTRDELSELSGLSTLTIRKYEKRGRRPGRDSYNKLAAFFNWETWR